DIIFKKESFLLRIAYNYKSTCLMDGKYEAFIPPENRKKFSLEDLHGLARKKGMIFPKQRKTDLLHRIFFRITVESFSVNYMNVNPLSKIKKFFSNLTKKFFNKFKIILVQI
ncbi:MAG: hypothetical protein II816_01540, partial [Elusimicrobia bacterium]|nr:hypothetical protein [Elusimicrobiota bacterium]